MNNRDRTLTLGVVGPGIAAAMFIVIGYIANIVQLVEHGNEVGGMFILKLVGIFFGPLGVILGWMGIFS